MNIDLTNSVVYDLNIEKGRTLNKTFKCEVYTGSTFIGYFDFSPYTAATLSVKSSPNNFVKITEFNTSDSTLSLGSNGEFTVAKSASDMSIRTGKYVYDMTLFSSAETIGFLRGNFKVIDQSYGEIPEDLDSNGLIRIRVKAEYIITGSTGGGGVSVSLFNTYTGDTDTRLAGIEDDIISLSGGSSADYIKVTGITNELGGAGSTISLNPIVDSLTINAGSLGGINIDYNSSTFQTSINLDAADDLVSGWSSLNVSSNNGITLNTSIIGNGAIFKLTRDDTPHYFDDLNTTPRGIVYGANYSSNYIARSLVDADFVTGITSTLGTSANNGLTKSGTNIRLGGTLTGTTTIQGNQDLNFSSLKAFNVSTISSGSGIKLNHFSKRLYLDYANNLSDFSYAQAGNRYGLFVTSASTYLSYTTTNFSTRKEINLGTASGIVVTDSVNNKGLVYGNNYSSNYTARSLVDAGYVTGLTSNITGQLTDIVVTASTTLTASTSMFVMVDSANGLFTIDLPVSPVNKQRVLAKDATGNCDSYPVTIDGNGKNIDDSGLAVINSNYGSLEFVYNSTFDKWLITAFAP